jgi:hypothetical protein
MADLYGQSGSEAERLLQGEGSGAALHPKPASRAGTKRQIRTTGAARTKKAAAAGAGRAKNNGKKRAVFSRANG